MSVDPLKTLENLLISSKNAKDHENTFMKMLEMVHMNEDLSPLFRHVTPFIKTNSNKIKKLIFEYLVDCSSKQRSFSLLSYGKLVEESKRPDPITRGLAIKTFSKLFDWKSQEEFTKVLNLGLVDKSAYVRRISLVGVLRLYKLGFGKLNSKILSMIENSVFEKDPLVSITAVCVLQEISLQMESISLIKKKIIFSLLQRINSFPQCGQCIILEIISKYAPSDESETILILNSCEKFFAVPNAAIVLAVSKIFIKCAYDLPKLKQQIFFRLEQPLLTLFLTSTNQLQYTILQHINLLCKQNKEIYQDKYKNFYLCHNEPVYNQKIKLSILSTISNKKNFQEILSMLFLYPLRSTLTKEIRKQAIETIGSIFLKLPIFPKILITNLLEYIETEIPYLIESSMIIIQDLLRLHPAIFSQQISVLIPQISPYIKTAKCKKSFIWILGEYGEKIPQSPYILEKYIEEFVNENDENVKLELLTSVAKNFFKRPPEFQSNFGKLLNYGTRENSEPDVLDRSLFYYRLIKTDIKIAESIIIQPKKKTFNESNRQTISSFSDTVNTQLIESLIFEFNTLSVDYWKLFQELPTPTLRDLRLEYEQDYDSDSSDDYEEVFFDNNDENEIKSNKILQKQNFENNNHYMNNNTKKTSIRNNENNNNNDDDDDGDDDNDNKKKCNNNSQPPPLLNPEKMITPKEFQNNWNNDQMTISFDLNLKDSCEIEQIEKCLGNKNIHVIASGIVSHSIKIFCYGNRYSSNIFAFAELVITNHKLSATIKSNNPPFLNLFYELLQRALINKY
ncbi:ap-4 complex subunit beta-1 [Anaeramoeba flamelloides]|uniref:AP complex subunit beta n=1 Tax=Anaeramoeba flamelloides TaxID=1746091 RepID=A0ABQ8XE59_9EUKA|nr:ap-4 complex subunit beta-1 [Anaeramoeba flamelloides]